MGKSATDHDRAAGPDAADARLRGAPIELLEALLRAKGRRTEAQRLFDQIRRVGLLDREYLARLGNDLSLPGPARKLVQEWQVDEPGRPVGCAWVALVFRDSKNPRWRGAPRLLRAQVAPARSQPSDGTTRTWDQGLSRVAGVLGRRIGARVPRVVDDWWRSSVVFTLQHPCGERDVLVSQDRSYELGAALALASAAFAAPVPEVSAALGCVGDDGTVLPLANEDREAFREKCAGLAKNVPNLRTVYVHLDDEDDARTALPGTVRVVTMEHVEEFLDLLATPPSQFAGPRKPRVTTQLLALVMSCLTLGLGSYAAFQARLADPKVQRYELGQALARSFMVGGFLLLWPAIRVADTAILSLVGQDFSDRLQQAIPDWPLFSRLLTLSTGFWEFALLFFVVAAFLVPPGDPRKLSALSPVERVFAWLVRRTPWLQMLAANIGAREVMRGATGLAAVRKEVGNASLGAGLAIMLLRSAAAMLGAWGGLVLIPSVVDQGQDDQFLRCLGILAWASVYLGWRPTESSLAQSLRDSRAYKGFFFGMVFSGIWIALALLAPAHERDLAVIMVLGVLATATATRLDLREGPRPSALAYASAIVERAVAVGAWVFAALPGDVVPTYVPSAALLLGVVTAGLVSLVQFPVFLVFVYFRRVAPT